ncbi:unnamed protein product [Urochloa humidicola]
MLLLVLVVWLLQLLLVVLAVPIGLPNCTTSCGGVSVPYPFGIEPGCYLLGFNVTCYCSSSTTPPLLFLWGNDAFVVTDISYRDSTVHISDPGTMIGPPHSHGDDNSSYDIVRPGSVLLGGDRLLLQWKLLSSVLRGLNETRAGNATCPHDLDTAACHSRHSTCKATATSLAPYFPNSRDLTGYVCKCHEGYQGNAYLPDGCQDIDECALPGKCFANCTNLPGKYLCECSKGTSTENGFSTGWEPPFSTGFPTGAKRSRLM